MSLTHPLVLAVLFFGGGLLLIAVLRVWGDRHQASLAEQRKMQNEIWKASGLPVAYTDLPHAIKEGNHEKMKAGVEYAYFQGTREKETGEVRRDLKVTMFTLETTNNPTFQTTTDSELTEQLKQEGWRYTGSLSYSADDLLTHFFQRP